MALEPPWLDPPAGVASAIAAVLLRRAGDEPGFTLPPVPCARQGGEVVAAMLSKVGPTVQMENIEWAQRLGGVYGQKAYDLASFSHVGPLDFGTFALPNDCRGCESAELNARLKGLWKDVPLLVNDLAGMSWQ
jgi:peptide/nickel transport system substrate-binding protein